jgi:hypothetical protein
MKWLSPALAVSWLLRHRNSAWEVAEDAAK